MNQPVLSRHRLPRFYRLGLTLLWSTPALLLALAVLAGVGLHISLFDPRFLLPVGLMLLPALHAWREGVDVLPDGLVVRFGWPRRYPYRRLDNWYYDSRPDRRVLTVWNACSRKVLEFRAGHLTDFPRLLTALKDNLRCRHWPL